LINKGFVLSGAITDDGLKVLEPYKTRRAIKIAAGFGSRMVPISLNTPKPLVRVNGVRIIDRLIDACLDAGITEIFIVRGYLGELFEIREANVQGHAHDFLTVGSMGHSSSIALEIAFQKPKSKIWIIDGDGAALMHMGAMALLGANKPRNLVHVVINNEAHETVGGQPTVMSSVDICQVAVRVS